MRRSDTTYITGSVFASLTAFFYCCTMWFSIRLPRYYPTEHAWKWVKEKGVPSQGWYGMQAFAFGAAGIVTLIVWLALKFLVPADTGLKPSQTRMLGAAATLIMVVCLGYILYYEFGRWGVFGLMGL